jgi:hypothetical protein
MLDQMIDGQLQVTAAVSLLENSRLVEWIPEQGRFAAVDRDVFEFYWQKSIDPVFGRLICWISFAAGAEFLAKGMCLVRGIEIRTEQPVPKYPTMDIDQWASSFRHNWKEAGAVRVTHFATLEGLTRQDKKTHAPSPLTRLCQTARASPNQENLLHAAYQLLCKSIRNRDVHAYVPNVRDSHYNLVPELFSTCFNVLVSWLPEGAFTLNRWRAEAKALISSL